MRVVSTVPYVLHPHLISFGSLIILWWSSHLTLNSYIFYASRQALGEIIDTNLKMKWMLFIFMWNILCLLFFFNIGLFVGVGFLFLFFFSSMSFGYLYVVFGCFSYWYQPMWNKLWTIFFPVHFSPGWVELSNTI